MTTWSLPSARPIAFKDCPAFQRLHISARWATESFHRLACIMNTTSVEDLYQLVLCRPSEPARVIGHLPASTESRKQGVYFLLRRRCFLLTGAHVVVYSKDAETDRAFFRDILGFRSVDAGHGWLIFAVPAAE